MTPEQVELKRLRVKAYNARPEVIARRHEYYMRPEVRAKYIERNKNGEQREYMKAWRQSPTGKAALKEAGLRQRGFTLALWEQLRALQGNACAICRRQFDDDLRFIHADHCHDTELPRGLLCQACNHAEGQIKRTGLSPLEYARRLSAYLESPPAKEVAEMTPNPERISK